jgi:hypothetical protein
MARSLRLALALLAVLTLGLAGAHTAAPAPTAHAHALRGLLPATRLAARAGSAAQPLTYHGGNVLHQSTAYALFWAPPDYPMPADNVAAFTRYFQDQQASSSGSAYAVAAQYFDAKGPAGTSSTFGGALTATDAAPATQCSDRPVIELPQPIRVCVTQSTLDGLVTRTAAAHAISPASSPIFFIFLPPGMGTCSDDGSACAYAQFAAYHSETDSDLLYAVLPYFDEPRYESVAHEHIEAITDPTGGGWFIEDTGEVADLCQDLAHTNQILGSTTYSLPLEWSNASGTCTSQAPPPTSPLTVVTTGKGTGAVAASFSGQTLSCPTSTRTRSCVTVARQRAQVALAALPDEGFAFGSWDAKTPCSIKKKARCTFTTTAGRATVTASFAVSHANEVYLLSVDVKGKGAVVYPDGKRCRSSCLERVRGGRALTLTAVPAKGWKLKAMRDDTHVCGSKPRCVLRLKASDNVTATFVRGS